MAQKRSGKPVAAKARPIAEFVCSKAELPFVTGEFRGSGTLVNSSAKLFHDVTGFLTGRPLSA